MRKYLLLNKQKKQFLCTGAFFVAVVLSIQNEAGRGKKAVSVYLSVNYRSFSTWSHVNNAATAKSRVSVLVTVMGHLRETFYFIYGCGKGYDGLA